MHNLAALPLLALLAGCAGQAQLTGHDTEVLIDRQVNRSMAYKSDISDEWDASCPAAGDCEDYALCKARKFLAAGVPAKDMAIVVVDRKNGRGSHAVLLSQGVVYDNLSFWPKPQAEVDAYRPLYACYLDGRGAFYLEGSGQPTTRPTLMGYLEFTRQGLGGLPKCQQAFKAMGVGHE